MCRVKYVSVLKTHDTNFSSAKSRCAINWIIWVFLELELDFFKIAVEHNIVADILSLFGVCYKKGLINEFTFCRQLAHISRQK